MTHPMMSQTSAGTDLSQDDVRAIGAEIFAAKRRDAGLGIYSMIAVDGISDDGEWLARVQWTLAQPVPKRADGKTSNGAASSRAKFMRHVQARYTEITGLTAEDFEQLATAEDGD